MSAVVVAVQNGDRRLQGRFESLAEAQKWARDRAVRFLLAPGEDYEEHGTTKRGLARIVWSINGRETFRLEIVQEHPALSGGMGDGTNAK